MLPLGARLMEDGVGDLLLEELVHDLVCLHLDREVKYWHPVVQGWVEAGAVHSQLDEGADGVADGLDDVGRPLVCRDQLVSLHLSLHDPDDPILHQPGPQGEDRCADVGVINVDLEQVHGELLQLHGGPGDLGPELPGPPQHEQSGEGARECVPNGSALQLPQEVPIKVPVFGPRILLNLKGKYGNNAMDTSYEHRKCRK